MQEFFDKMIEEWKVERTKTQMTLGKLIKELDKFPKDKEIVNIHSPHSYRGYYSDLSFEMGKGYRTVGDLMEELIQDCLDESFEGYKGGDFYMGGDTPIWVADYGSVGERLMSLVDGDKLDIITKEEIL